MLFIINRLTQVYGIGVSPDVRGSNVAPSTALGHEGKQ